MKKKLKEYCNEIRLYSVFSGLEVIRALAEKKNIQIEYPTNKDNNPKTISVLSFNSFYDTAKLLNILIKMHVEKFLILGKKLLAREFL